MATDLEQRRVAAGCSMRELARRSGLSPMTISLIEAGRHTPRAGTIRLLERALEGGPEVVSRRSAPTAADVEGLVRETPGAPRDSIFRQLWGTNTVRWAAINDALAEGRVDLVTLSAPGHTDLRRLFPVGGAGLASRRVLERVQAEPGRWSVRLAKRHLGPGAEGAARALVAAGLLVEAECDYGDHGGSLRTHEGLFLPSDKPLEDQGLPMTGAELAELMARAGWSQAGLAKMLGLSSQASVSSWVRKGPPVSRWRTLWEVLEAAPEAPPATAKYLDVIRNVVRSHPGAYTRQTVGPAFGANRAASNQTVLAAVEQLLAAGELHEQITAYTARNGARRCRLGLHPGSKPAGPDVTPLSGAQLRRLREGAGWELSALARRLGRTPTSVCRWEHRAGPPLAWVPEILDVLAHEPPPTTSRLKNALPAVAALIREEPWLTRAQVRARVPRRGTESAIEQLLESGEVYEHLVPYLDTAGRHLSRLELRPGPPPMPPAERLSGAGFERARRERGLGRAATGRLLGVSDTVILQWERGDGVPEGWGFAEKLLALPVVVELDLVAPEPAELVAHRLASGLSQREAAARVGVSVPTWSNWETGKERIPEKRIGPVCDAVGMARRSSGSTR